MAATKLWCSLTRTSLNHYKRGFGPQFCRFESTSGSVLTQDAPTKTSWKFLFLAFGFPVSGFLLYKTVIEPGSQGLSEEERKMPFVTRFMMKYFMEDPIENKQKIHKHIRACREVADKRLYVNNANQKEIAPGKFRETIAKEKDNITYDTKMY